MKIVIEKELCNPIDAYNIPGPYYHVVRIDEETGEREVLKTFEKDIKEAARYAERELDIEKLAIAYKENPKSFESCTHIDADSIKPVTEFFSYEGTVTGAGDRYTTIRYEDTNGNAQLFYGPPGNYKYGDKISILFWKKEENERQ